MPDPLIVVQVGDDDTVFTKHAPSDTLNRQLGYGQELERLQPGSQLILVSFTRNPAARRFKQENVTFVPLLKKRRYDIFKLFWKLRALHQEQSIHVISTQNIHEDGWTALLFGYFYNVPVVGQIHYDIFSPVAQKEIFRRRWVGQFRYWLAMRLIKHYAALRVVGQRICQQLITRELHKNVYVIPVPVTMSQNIAEQVESSQKRVLFVGRLVPVKNLAAWLKVAALVLEHEPDTQFEIVGDGPSRQELEEIRSQLGLDQVVHFRGALPYEQLSDIYQSATVFLITSNYEGFGRVVVEAYLHGVPVVGTQITGIEDIVDNGQTGFLHPVGDLEGMANSVFKLLRDQSLQQKMGSDGYALVRSRFDPETLSHRWMKLLATVAINHKARTT